MALCAICGISAGFASAHPECERMVAGGQTAEEVRALLRVSRAEQDSEELRKAADRLSAIARWLFPIFGLGGAGANIALFGAKDDGLVLFCVLLGIAEGLLIAWIIYTWLRLQALTALRLAKFFEDR